MRAALTLFFCLLILSCRTTCGFAACGNTSLDILLTNDDGFDRPGIRALREALVAKGHRVTLVAPSHNYSGSSTALSLAGPIAVEKVEDHVYSVEATPATAVLFGVSTVYEPARPPDLVVSGTNEGANVGAATPISGTVGATIAAITLLPKAVPGIAFSTNLVGGDPSSVANRKHFAEVAAFAARLVNALAEKACGTPLLPHRTALNVNYPARAPQDISGVKLARQGWKPFAEISFRQVTPGNYVPVRVPATGADRPDSDAKYLDQGYITISVLDGDYSRAPDPRSLFGPLAELKP